MNTSPYMWALVMDAEYALDEVHEYRCVICGMKRKCDYVPECHGRAMKQMRKVREVTP